MKSTYLSQYDFLKHCPCAYQLIGYAESISSTSADVQFWTGRQADENTYIAEFNVCLPSGCITQLEVSCTMNPDHSCTYEKLKETDVR